MDDFYIKKKRISDKGLIITLAIVLGVVLILAVVLFVLLLNSGDDKENKSSGKPSPTISVSATPVPTSVIPGLNPYLPIPSNGVISDPNSTSAPGVSGDTAAVDPTKFDTINERFVPLDGYERVSADKDSFAEFIRNYSLKDFGTSALCYDDTLGLIVSEEASTMGVFSMPNALNRWMQCADSIVMLYAEYLYSMKQFDKISFTFANGFVCDWISYMQGNRFNAQKSVWELKAEPSDTYETFQKYLDLVYQYANTDSLARDMSSTPAMKDISVGDAFVVGVKQLKEVAASVNPDAEVKYGHAILVVDVAVDTRTGERIFMLAEGNTPATEISVIENPNPEMGVWFKFNEVGSFIKSAESGIPWSAAWLKRFPGQ